jgi:hypothetical protein
MAGGGIDVTDRDLGCSRSGSSQHTPLGAHRHPRAMQRSAVLIENRQPSAQNRRPHLSVG